MGENHVLKKAGSDFFLRLRLAVTGETGGVQASARKGPGPLGSSLRFIFSNNILVIVIKKYNLSFSLQVEPDCGAFCDDTALNGV